jgi:hypothetical protein
VKRALWASPLLLTGCLGITPFFHVDEDLPPPVERTRMGAVGFATTPPGIFEPAASRLYPTAGTIDWAPGGTEEGFGFLGGAVRIEEIRRDNPEGFLKVQARLRNRTDRPIAARYQIVFYDRDGVPLLSEQAAPAGAILEPFGSATLVNGCRLPEAAFFKIYLVPSAG